MQTMRIKPIGILVLFSLFLLFALGRVSAQNFNVTFDEYGNGFLNRQPSAVSFHGAGSDLRPFDLDVSTAVYRNTRGRYSYPTNVTPPLTSDVVRFDNSTAGGGQVYFFLDLPDETPVPFADTGIPPPPFPPLLYLNLARKEVTADQRHLQPAFRGAPWWGRKRSG